MIHFASVAAMAEAVGKPLTPSEWLLIDQSRIDAFAKVTGDFQWIHVDVERAKCESPFGGTIAHGYLVLSLVGELLPQLYSVDAKSILNYGIDKLRFLAPVPSGSRIRLTGEFTDCTPASGGLRVTTRLTFELENSDKPAIVADIVFLCFD